tara:strand:- start:139 stop:432 length:294 start_codon:yes stop_codon:yes gene_type:complete
MMNKKGVVLTAGSLIALSVIAVVALIALTGFTFVLSLNVFQIGGFVLMVFALLGLLGLGVPKIPTNAGLTLIGVGVGLMILPVLTKAANISLAAIVP